MVSKTPFVECLEESSAPCGAMRFFWIKKKKRERERDNTLAVEKVCNKYMVLHLRQMIRCTELVLEPQWELGRFCGWVTRTGHQRTNVRLQRYEHYA